MVAAAFAATPDSIRPKAVKRYPVRIDLKTVTAPGLELNNLVLFSEPAGGGQGQEASSQDAVEQAPLQRRASVGGNFLDGLGEADSNQPRVPDNSGQGYALGDGPFIPLDFDLAGSSDADSTLQVRKSVQMGDAVLGQVQVRIDDTAAVYVARKDVFALLPDTPRAAQSLKGDYVRLSALREVGINLRYDATGDRFILAQ